MILRSQCPFLPGGTVSYNCTAMTVSAKCLARKFNSRILSWTDKGLKTSRDFWPSLLDPFPNKNDVEPNSDPESLLKNMRRLWDSYSKRASWSAKKKMNHSAISRKNVVRVFENGTRNFQRIFGSNGYAFIQNRNSRKGFVAWFLKEITSAYSKVFTEYSLCNTAECRAFFPSSP